MKLYTEEQLRSLLDKMDVIYSLKDLTPIELPSDEKIMKEQERQMLIGLLEWMNKVAQDNPMALETDSEDIVDMYLQGYYTKEK